MFILIFDWVDEETGQNYDNWVYWFDTKEELLEAYKHWRNYYAHMIEIGRLYLSAAVNYSWADIEQLF